MAYSTKYQHWSAWESLKNSSSSTITISSECNTQWFMVVFCIWIVVIPSAVITLAWLQKERRKVRWTICPFYWLVSLVLQQCSPVKLMVPLSMEALGNAWYDSWRPWNNLTQTFQVCHLCTFNVAAIFFGAIPTYGVLPYAMILLTPSRTKPSHKLFCTVASLPFYLATASPSGLKSGVRHELITINFSTGLKKCCYVFTTVCKEKESIYCSTGSEKERRKSTVQC